MWTDYTCLPVHADVTDICRMLTLSWTRLEIGLGLGFITAYSRLSNVTVVTYFWMVFCRRSGWLASLCVVMWLPRADCLRRFCDDFYLTWERAGCGSWRKTVSCFSHGPRRFRGVYVAAGNALRCSLAQFGCRESNASTRSILLMLTWPCVRLLVFVVRGFHCADLCADIYCTLRCIVFLCSMRWLRHASSVRCRRVCFLTFSRLPRSQFLSIAIPPIRNIIRANAEQAVGR